MQKYIAMRFLSATGRIRTSGLPGRRTTTGRYRLTMKREICWLCTAAPKTGKSLLLVITTGFSGVLQCLYVVVVKWWSTFQLDGKVALYNKSWPLVLSLITCSSYSNVQKFSGRSKEFSFVTKSFHSIPAATFLRENQPWCWVGWRFLPSPCHPRCGSTYSLLHRTGNYRK